MTKTIQKLPQIIANWLEECKNTDDIDIDDAVEYYMAYASDKIIHYLNYWFAKPSNIELFTTIWNNPDAFDDSSFTYKNPDGQPLIMEVKTVNYSYLLYRLEVRAS